MSLVEGAHWPVYSMVALLAQPFSSNANVRKTSGWFVDACRSSGNL